MLAIRRFYIYMITFISLFTFLVGISNTLRLILAQWLESSGYEVGNDYYRSDQFSLWGALMVVGGIVWSIHWLLAQRQVNPIRAGAVQERQATQRNLLIYATLFVAGWQIFFALPALIQSLLTDLWGGQGQNYESGGISGPISVLLVYTLAWLYYWRVRQANYMVTSEQGAGATLRRWYFYLACYCALSVGMYALANLARYLWQQLLPETSQSPNVSVVNWPVASNTGWILAGFGAWYWHWRWSQRLMGTSREEKQATLPKFYLYALILQTVCVTLTNLALFLYYLLRFLIGTNPFPKGESLSSAGGSVLITAGIYGMFWIYHRRVILRKMKDDGLTARLPYELFLHNLYHYLVALISLGVMAAGLTWLVRILFDFWLGEASTRALSLRGWGNQISLFVSLILPGGSFWYLNWRLVQRQVQTGDDIAFRHSIIRRVYLYLIIFCSVLTLLVGLAFLVYRIFLGIGTSFNSFQVSQLSWALGASITAVVALAYHYRILIEDQLVRTNKLVVVQGESTISGEQPNPGGTMTSNSEKKPFVPYVVLLLSGGDVDEFKRILDSFKKVEAKGSRVIYFSADGLTPEELGSWLAKRKEGLRYISNKVYK